MVCVEPRYTRANFFERVYLIVRQIPHGQVTSYGAIARMLGYPRGARTVGWALHSLPAASDVPWQRVINSQGRISTHRRQHDLSGQRQLLEAEGVLFDERARVDFDRFGWEGLTWLEVDALAGTR